MERYQKQQILKDIKKKLVFLIGPRQIAKTWLAQNIAESYSKSVYLNYDNCKDREIIQSYRTCTQITALKSRSMI